MGDQALILDQWVTQIQYMGIARFNMGTQLNV